jgi:hypothetical protein
MIRVAQRSVIVAEGRVVDGSLTPALGVEHRMSTGLGQNLDLRQIPSQLRVFAFDFEVRDAARDRLIG